MFFYDPKYKKHYYETDDDKQQLICWAEEGVNMHLRVVKTYELRALFDPLPVRYSKIIYDTESGRPWVEYEGEIGLSCIDLVQFVRGFDITEE